MGNGRWVSVSVLFGEEELLFDDRLLNTTSAFGWKEGG